ncbi:hypothetical protein VPT02_068 [Vibrio phage VPT02]|nr:hypothetical protein VPT02_068 [Vibrio phage VPT02]
MGFGPAYGTGRGGGAVDIFTKKDGNPAIFANTGARDTYFTSNPDELAKVKSSGDAVAIGTTNQITAAYVYKQNAWQPIATNFKGDKGAPGAPGDGIDYSHLTQGQIPKWDATAKRFTNSGVTSKEDGSITLEPASLHLGSHSISSSAENVTFTNVVTNKVYAPLWQEVGYGTKTGYIRSHGPRLEVELETDNSKDLINPFFNYTAPADASLFGARIEVAQDATNVEVHVLLNNEELWLVRLGDLSAGEQDIFFPNPADFKAGNTYDVRVSSSDGSDVILKGSQYDTPKATLHVAKWTDEIVASQEWLKTLKLVNDITLSGDQFSFTMLDGTSKTVTLPVGGSAKAAPYNFIELLTDRGISVSELTNSTPIFSFEEDTSITLTMPATSTLPVGRDSAFIVENRTTTPAAVVEVKASNTDIVNRPGLTSFNVPTNHTILFVSNVASNSWHAIVLASGGTGGSSLNEGQVVKALETTSSGKDLLVRYYDDTSSTLTFNPWVDDIAKLNKAVSDLERHLKNKTKFYVYKGDTIPTDVPRGSRGGYYFTFYGTTSELTLTTPVTASKISDGTILFIDNNSPDYSVTVNTPQGETIAGQASVSIAPEAAAWYVRNDNNWQELYSGFLPRSHKDLINEMKALVSADNNFIRNLNVQSDDPTQTAVAATSLEFKGFDVTTPADDTTKGIIKFKGATFENPDGSKVVTDVLKLVGMEVVDPGDGTPPKLMLTGGALPLPHPTSAYAFFDAAATVPDTVDFTSLTKFTNGKVTVTKSTADPQYAYILIPAAEGAGADRIGEQGGLPAFWDKSSKTYTVNGQSETFTVFRSPYPLKEQDVTLIIYH